MPAVVFTAAINALFADENLGLDAAYCAAGAGPGVPARVVIRRPDRVVRSALDD